LGAEAGVGALSIDEGDEGQTEAISELEYARRLAIALRFGRAEIALDSLAGGLAALMTEHRHLVLAEVTESRDHRAIVGEATIPVQLKEPSDQRVDVVEGLGAHGITRQTHPFDRAQGSIRYLRGGRFAPGR